MRMFHPKTIEYLSKMKSYEDFYRFLAKDIASKGMTLNEFFVKNKLDKSDFYRGIKGKKKSVQLNTIDKLSRLIS